MNTIIDMIFRSIFHWDEEYSPRKDISYMWLCSKDGFNAFVLLIKVMSTGVNINGFDRVLNKSKTMCV